MRKRVVILASGAGSLTQAILDATDLDIQVVAVVSDTEGAPVLDRAKQANVNTSVIQLKGDRAAWDRQLFDQVDQYQPDLVISAGFMKILSPQFVNYFPTINSHPALLPAFPPLAISSEIANLSKDTVLEGSPLINPSSGSIYPSSFLPT